jgi:hypothetical protein
MDLRKAFLHNKAGISRCGTAWQGSDLYCEAQGVAKLGRRSSLGVSGECASEYVEELYGSGGLACREEPRGSCENIR